MNREEKLMSVIQTLGVDEYKKISAEDIIFSELVFSQCRRNTCRNYNLNHACPPRSGTLQEIKDRLFNYRNGCIISKIMSIATSKDFNASRTAFKSFVVNIREQLEPHGFLVLGEGPCNICERCAALDEAPCRFPGRIRYSMEGSGIDVVRMSMKYQMTYNAGGGKIGFFVLVMYND